MRVNLRAAVNIREHPDGRFASAQREALMLAQGAEVEHVTRETRARRKRLHESSVKMFFAWLRRCQTDASMEQHRYNAPRI